MKQLARTCLAATSRVSGLLRFAEKKAHGRLTILCYHRIMPAEQKADYPLADLVVTPESFRQHCLTLKRYYEVLPLHEAVDDLLNRSSHPRPLAAITFDDGYRDNLTHAAPVLGELSLRATFFVIAGLAGTEEIPWYDRLGRAVQALQQQDLDRTIRDPGQVTARGEPTDLDEHLALPAKHLVELAKTMQPDKRANLIAELSDKTGGTAHASPQDSIMSWDQLAGLIDRGHEIGSHGLTHELLTLLDDHSLEAEVVESRGLIEEKLNQPVRSFSYPNGDVDERVAQVVASAGYRCAVTTETGNNDPKSDAYRLRRWFIHEDRLSGLSRGSSTTLLRMELCGLASRIFQRRSPAPLHS